MFKTEQEEFWAGEFGDQYLQRNNFDKHFYSKLVSWGKMLRSAHGVKSIRELGCNIGLNLLALNKLQPDLDLFGVEINENAVKKANELNVAAIKQASILDPIKDKQVDLTFTSGVLIHINPQYLKNVYDNLVNGSNRYILIFEYFNPSPVVVNYRGNEERLYKRDFAGELIDQYGLKLIDYGFIYKRDNFAPRDDSTWFLLEK